MGIDSGNMSDVARHLRDTCRFDLNFTADYPGGFAAWRQATRAKLRELTGMKGGAAVSQGYRESWRGEGYSGHLLDLHLPHGETAAAFLLLPDAAAPVPGVLLLHDHGSRFDIGKEKMISWPGGPKAAEAQAWAERLYGGRFAGDALARRGFAVLCVDALGWGSREGNGYEAQQALAANLMQFGSSPAAVVAQEDLAALEYLAALPGIDASRLAAFGFSMGGFRAWQVAALGGAVAAVVSAGWMGTLQGLMQPGNNQLRGQSAFYMLHPPLAGRIDYPHFAALAAPLPALFHIGREDRHFPQPVAEAAFAQLHALWAAAGADERLETRLWPAPHIFPPDQQDAAIDWLERNLRQPRR